jgi:Holliday junction resolvase
VSDHRHFGVADLFSKRLIGHLGEIQPANYLRGYGFNIYFPGGSRGPADFLAVNGDIFLAVQCKSSQSSLSNYDTERLLEFADPIGAIPIFTARISGRVRWHTHDGDKWSEILYPRWGRIVPSTRTEAAASAGAGQ